MINLSKRGFVFLQIIFVCLFVLCYCNTLRDIVFFCRYINEHLFLESIMSRAGYPFNQKQYIKA